MNKTIDSMFPHFVVKEAYFLRYKDADYVVTWSDFYREEEIGKPPTFPSCLMVSDPNGVRVDNEHEIKLFAIEQRFRQIKDELNIRGSVTDRSVILHILDRAFAGEWMGQYSSSECLYFDSLGKILNLSLGDVFSIAHELIKEGYVRDPGYAWVFYPPKEN